MARLKLVGGENHKAVVRGILSRIIGPGLNDSINLTGKFKKISLEASNFFPVILGNIHTN